MLCCVLDLMHYELQQCIEVMADYRIWLLCKSCCVQDSDFTFNVIVYQASSLTQLNCCCIIHNSIYYNAAMSAMRLLAQRGYELSVLQTTAFICICTYFCISLIINSIYFVDDECITYILWT